MTVSSNLQVSCWFAQSDFKWDFLFTLPKRVTLNATIHFEISSHRQPCDAVGHTPRWLRQTTVKNNFVPKKTSVSNITLEKKD